MPKRGKSWSRDQRKKYQLTMHRKRKKKEPDTLVVENMSGEIFDLDVWSKGDRAIALKVANWLTKQDTNVAISITDDGAIMLDYTFGGRLQPPIRVYSGKVVLPKGTDTELMLRFLKGE